MTVEQYTPKQTTTLDIPSKTIEENQAELAPQDGKASGSRIGFVSLGCPKES